MNGIKCSNCGANLIDNGDIKFCSYCGTAIPADHKQQIDININNRYEDVAEVEKQRRLAETEKKKAAHIDWKIVARLIVALMIPVCFVTMDPPIIPMIASVFLLIVCVMIR